MQGAMETIEEFLSRNKWIAGPQLTIADIDLSSVLGLTTVSLSITDYVIK